MGYLQGGEGRDREERDGEMRRERDQQGGGRVSRVLRGMGLRVLGLEDKKGLWAIFYYCYYFISKSPLFFVKISEF